MPKSGLPCRFLRAIFAICIFLSACGATALPQGVQLAQEKPTVDAPAMRPEEVPSPTVANSKTETERYTLSHERYDKAVKYSRASYAIYFLWVASGIFGAWFFLQAGVAARIRDFVEELTENRLLQGLLFLPILVIGVAFFELPALLYWHFLSVRYQQSVQGWGSWLLDLSKREALYAGAAMVLGSLLFWLMRRSPRRWWAYFWACALPISLIVFFITPWFIDPLFYKYEPLDKTNPELVTAIERVTARAGLSIPRDRIFLMRASAKTKQINAYVTGVGASKRVVVWDNTVNKTTTNETVFIFGHEAGHYVLGHVRNGVLFFAMALFLAMFAAFHALHFLLGKFSAAWRIYGPQDLVCLAVLILLFHIFSFLGTPVESAFSRWQEHNADIFGLEAIHGIVPDANDVAAHAFQILGEEDLSDPNPPPFVTFWLYSHPPLAERLVFAHSYDPWSKAQEPKYLK